MVPRRIRLQRQLHRNSKRCAGQQQRSGQYRSGSVPVDAGVATLKTVGPSTTVGGSTNIYASNISLTDNGKNYYGTYFNDDWKITPKLTVNLGLRWDFFGSRLRTPRSTSELCSWWRAYRQPDVSTSRRIPSAASLSSSFTTLLAADGIALDITNKYGKGLGNSQKSNFAPRVGFAYQASPKLVVRGGFGMFYNGFENRGYSPNLGENYPFQFNFNYGQPNDWTPRTFPGCAAAGPGGTATFESGFACTPLDPDCGHSQWVGPARNSVQLSNSVHHERQLHVAISAHADDDGAGWLTSRLLLGTSKCSRDPTIRRRSCQPGPTHQQCRAANWRSGQWCNLYSCRRVDCQFPDFGGTTVTQPPPATASITVCRPRQKNVLPAD